ncbi:hypothetical protein BJ166DRAFT_576113 [Pestalotiopsis sp. NC0098]|nr:hypothetical protein BJ166DRAFT_576113 [Pestalotiopsis sp. NC0098]
MSHFKLFDSTITKSSPNTNFSLTTVTHPTTPNFTMDSRGSSYSPSSASREAYATRDVYRSSTAKDYKKTVTSRPSAVVHNENARGYDRNEPRPSYSSSSYRTR